MKLKIYQIKNRDCKYCFMDYQFAQQNGFNLEDYQIVHEDEFNKLMTLEDTLEDIFDFFNRGYNTGHLEKIGFKGHSLSVSDIVELNGVKYYCDHCGWKEIA